MSLADDIAAARQGGRSDTDILTAYKAFDPSKAGDIQSALDSGKSPGDVLDALGAYDTQYGNNVENQSLWQKAKGAVEQGVSSELAGLSNTAKLVGGGPGVVSGFLDQGAKATAPAAPYTGASAGLDNTNKTLLDRAGYIPRAMVEGAPGMATDLAAGEAGAQAGGALGVLGGPFAEATVPIGAAIGGVGGFLGSYYLRNFGNDAKAAAVARTGDPSATPNSEDLTRAAVVDGASGALSRVGLKTGLGGDAVAAGESVIPALAGGAAKAAGVDAATNVATDAIHQVGIQQQNPLSDPSGIALNALQGAATGVALRAPGAAKEAYQTYKFSDIDPVNGASLAALYGGSDFSTPSKAFDSMTRVDSHLDDQANYWNQKTQPQLNALQAANGNTDNTDLVLRGVRTDIDKGNVVDGSRLDILDDRLGDFHEGANLVNTLRLQNSQNLVKQAGNFDEGKGTFGGGISSTPLFSKYVNPMSKFGGRSVTLGIGEFALGGHLPIIGHAIDPMTGLYSLGGQLGLYGAAKGVDSLLGNTNPLGSFMGKFGSSKDGPPPWPSDHSISGLPSFVQTMSDAKTDNVANQTAKSVGDLARQALLSQRAKTDQVANDAASNVAQAVADRINATRQQPQLSPQVQADPTSIPSSFGSVTHKGHTVVYSKDGVNNVSAYEAGIRQRLEDRQQVMDAAKASLPPETHSIIDTIHHSINGPTIDTAHDAEGVISDIANDHPEHTGAILDALDQPKLWATFKRGGGDRTPTPAQTPTETKAPPPAPQDASARPEVSTPHSKTKVTGVDAVVAAAHKANPGGWSTRLSAIRPFLSHMSRSEQDAALKDILLQDYSGYKPNTMSLMRIDDRRSITKQDEDAAFKHNGTVFHLLFHPVGK